MKRSVYAKLTQKELEERCDILMEGLKRCRPRNAASKYRRHS